MEALPDAIVQHVLSHMKSARDVAVCNCVSKRWQDSMPYIKSLFFPRNSFDSHIGKDSPDEIIWKMLSSVSRLEELVVYSPFSGAGLFSWLSVIGSSLRNLELRMDNLAEQHQGYSEINSKLDCISVAKNLESLKLWGVLMTQSPKWDIFQKLQNLEIVGARMEDPALTAMLWACPNLTNLLLLGCEGLKYVSIELPYLQQCKLDFYGLGNCFLSMNCPEIEVLEVQGCSRIRIPETRCLRCLSIANNAGKLLLLFFFFEIDELHIVSSFYYIYQYLICFKPTT